MDIKLVYLYSAIKMMHGQINLRSEMYLAKLIEPKQASQQNDEVQMKLFQGKCIR